MTMTKANPVWLGITNVAVLAVDASNYVASIETGHVFVPKTPETFTYDADGNLLSDGRWNYTWDAENRLVKVESRSDTPQGSWRRVGWQYDALGRRIRQITSDGSSANWVVTEDLKLVSDPVLFGRHVAELRASDNTLVRSYVWGLDLSGAQAGPATLQAAGGVGGLLWVTVGPAVPSGPGAHFCAYDGNGNIVALSAASDGSATARYEYGPFGEPIRVTGPAAAVNPFRFSTKRTCNNTDLVLYEYRAYSASLGRWLIRDPIMESGV
jgi:RHS repeat-associated protein